MAVDEAMRLRRFFTSIRLRQRLSARNLGALTPDNRLLVRGLLGATALAMCGILMALLGFGPLHQPTVARGHAAIGLVVFGALTLALSVLVGALCSAAEAQGARGRLRRLGVQLLPGVGLAWVAFSVLAMDEVHRTYARPAGAALRAAEWLALGVACVYVLRRTPHASDGLLDANRALKVVFPAMLWVIALAVPVAAGFYNGRDVAAILLPAMSMFAFAGMGLVIGLTVSAGVNGLERTRQRGQAVAGYVGARKGLIFVIVAAKLIALTLVWWAYRILRPREQVLLWTRPTLIMACVAALVAILLFAVDARVELHASDHTTVARYAGRIVGAAVGTALSVVVVVAMMATIVTVRWASMIGVGVLITFGVGHSRFQNRNVALVGYPVAALLAITIASWLGPGHRVPKPVVDATNPSTMKLLTFVATVLAFLVIVAAMVSIVVVVIRRRRFGWLTYVVTVAVWFMTVACWDGIDRVHFMEFDLALTVLLGMAGALLVLGAQRVIDGFEIVVAVSVTFLLIEVPMLLDLLPGPLQVVSLFLAVLGPGVAVAWKQTSVLGDPSTARDALVRLATMSLVYCQIATILWLKDFDVSGYLKILSNFSLSYLSIPLLLLLVAAHDPQRKVPAAPAATDGPSPRQ